MDRVVEGMAEVIGGGVGRRVGPVDELLQTRRECRVDLRPSAGVCGSIGSPSSIVDADQPGHSEQGLASDPPRQLGRFGACGERGALPAGVVGDVAVEPASCPCVGREPARFDGVHGASEVHTIVA